MSFVLPVPILSLHVMGLGLGLWQMWGWRRWSPPWDGSNLRAAAHHGVVGALLLLNPGGMVHGIWTTRHLARTCCSPLSCQDEEIHRWWELALSSVHPTAKRASIRLWFGKFWVHVGWFASQGSLPQHCPPPIPSTHPWGESCSYPTHSGARMSSIHS